MSPKPLSTAQPLDTEIKPVPLAQLLKHEQPAMQVKPEPVREIGGRKDGPDPTRYGDWEKNGRCVDF